MNNTATNTRRRTTTRQRQRKNSRMMIAFVLSASTMPCATTAFVVAPPPTFTTATTSTTSRHMSATLELVSDFYQNFPLESAVLTCGVKASVADTIAQVKPQIEENNKNKQEQLELESSSSSSLSSTISQQLEAQLQPQMISSTSMPSSNINNNIDWEARRNLAYVLYGGIFIGLMSHLEYSYVFPFMFGYEHTLQILVEKVFFDNLVAAPLFWLPPAYFIKAWVYRADGNGDNDTGILKEGFDKYVTDVRDNQLLTKYWTIWFPAQTISFSVVPDHLRVAFMASISFFWFILFSSVASKGDSVNVVDNDAITTTNE